MVDGLDLCLKFRFFFLQLIQMLDGFSQVQPVHGQLIDLLFGKFDGFGQPHIRYVQHGLAAQDLTFRLAHLGLQGFVPGFQLIFAVGQFVLRLF